MLRPRIIPCLLVHKKGLVKTINFEKPKYVGDPINAVKIFNEKEVDELMVIDIDATVNNETPNFDLINKLAIECRMPFCYGGGVKTVEQAKRIISLGAEKVGISSAGLKDLDFLKKIGEAVGIQSVVLIIDVKKKMFGGYDVYTHNGKKKSKWKLNDLLKSLAELEIGEVVINSIDRDGTMKGYDLDLIDKFRNVLDMPITALGGAGTLNDIKELISRFKIIGAAAGSLFVFKGKYRAVLISYPEHKQKKELYS